MAFFHRVLDRMAYEAKTRGAIYPVMSTTAGAGTLGGGTATAASWPILASGTLLTTPEAGALERDASVAYLSLAASQRGVLTTLQGVYQTAAFTLANDTNLNACFTAAQDTFTARAATTYLFEAYISLTTGATSHTTAFGLKGAGTATFTSCNYHAIASSAAAATLAAAQNAEVEVSTAQVITAASTAVRTRLLLKGSFQVLAAGTIIPSIQFSADPTGTCTTNIGSYFVMVPIGTNAVTSVGPWA